MCGRTCLTLEPGEITIACRHKNQNETDANKDKGYCEPEYRSEFNCGRKYTPSYNIAPTDITPVLVSIDHFYDEVDSKNLESNRVVVPMLWGMIPFWNKGDWRKHGLSTNNCRLEHLLESKLYLPSFKRGQRCVILCEGFYEWQTTKLVKSSEREAYLLHMPQKEKLKIYDRNTWKPNDINLLKLAGLFDIWEDENGDKIYSYSIITFESSKIMSWLHHRMPAILETEDQVNKWLDFKNVSNDEALAILRPATQLKWYRVSNIVNNSRNKTDQCNKPIEIIRTQKPAMNRIMSSWLNIRKRKGADIAQPKCDLGDDELQNSGTSTTNESESELSISGKRMRFTSQKSATRNLQHIDDEKGLICETKETNSKNDSDIKLN